MSAVADNAPLGGFEQRLLTQLRAHVAEQPAVAAERPALTGQAEAISTAPAATPRCRRIPRLSLPAAAALAALVTGVLTLLPAATPTLAQAFPILNGPARRLPARLTQALRAQWRTGTRPRFDLSRAYAFRTAAGTGYVLVDRGSRWMCILIPGFATDAAGGRCERVTVARLGQTPLEVRISAGAHRQEIVALLPRGTAASALTASGAQQAHTRSGVLAVVSRGPVTVTTTAAGKRSSRVTYTP
jgi:hypothetical protein